MPKIVAVHGVGQQLWGEEVLAAAWRPALRDGMLRAGVARTALPADADLAIAFYGDLFRGGATKGSGDPPFEPADVEADWEARMLEAWWRAAAACDPQVPGPDAATKGRTPAAVQRALNALARSRFFAGLAERALIGDLKQVHRYLVEAGIRSAARQRVLAAIGPDTQIVLGHSLGSVVAYEALCARPGLPVRTLVTLGSPLGIPKLIFDRLQPAPVDGRGAPPAGVLRWVNVADKHDVVALVKELRPLFGAAVGDLTVDNEARAHDVTPYLTARETGEALAAGLRP